MLLPGGFQIKFASVELYLGPRFVPNLILDRETCGPDLAAIRQQVSSDSGEQCDAGESQRMTYMSGVYMR